MFVYQTTFNMLELKKDLLRDQKGFIILNLHHFTWCLLPSMKYFGSKIGTQFISTPLVVLIIEQINYRTKTVKV